MLNQGEENLVDQLVKARNDSKNPVYNIPLDMNINKFKKMLDNSEFILTKAQRNKLIRDYKNKAWQEYDEIVKGFSSLPTRGVKNGQ